MAFESKSANSFRTSSCNMIKATRFVTHLTILFIIALNIQVAYCQFSGAPKFNARKEDVPLIRCQVCELLADNAYAQVKALKDTATPKKRVRTLLHLSIPCQSLQQLYIFHDLTAWRYQFTPAVWRTCCYQRHRKHCNLLEGRRRLDYRSTSSSVW